MREFNLREFNFREFFCANLISANSGKTISGKLADDVNEMEKMLNEYLQFSSNRSNEKSEEFDISELIYLTAKKYENNKIIYNKGEATIFSGRKNLIRRCLNNIIDNSIKYANNIIINMSKNINNLTISIEDDGPGIPISEYDNVFKPFYKIDKSRGDSKSSVGLGMSIASDIIQSHGGNIRLEKSKLLKGLKVKIFLPL